MTTERIDPLAVMGNAAYELHDYRPGAKQPMREALKAVAELVEADREYDEAREQWDEPRYEVDSYGVPGSGFLRCLACDNESGAGILNKGVTHEDDCLVAALERADARRAAALAAFGRQG